MSIQKIIVFIFTIFLLAFMINMALFTMKKWQFKTYAFGILIIGLSLLSVATFLDMTEINFASRHLIIKICFTLGAGFFSVGLALWSSYTKKMIEMFENSSLTDHMTGVFNRNGIERAFTSMTENGKSFFVLMCDLDKTKKINDNYGHVYGDEYIKGSVAIMKNEIRMNGYLGRIGGDEFIILMDYEDEHLLNKRINEIKKRVSEIFKDSEIGISIGYSSFPRHGKELNELILAADKKMYEDKLNN